MLVYPKGPPTNVHIMWDVTAVKEQYYCRCFTPFGLLLILITLFTRVSWSSFEISFSVNSTSIPLTTTLLAGRAYLSYSDLQIGKLHTICITFPNFWKIFEFRIVAFCASVLHKIRRDSPAT